MSERYEEPLCNKLKNVLLIYVIFPLFFCLFLCISFLYFLFSLIISSISLMFLLCWDFFSSLENMFFHIRQPTVSKVLTVRRHARLEKYKRKIRKWKRTMSRVKWKIFVYFLCCLLMLLLLLFLLSVSFSHVRKHATFCRHSLPQLVFIILLKLTHYRYVSNIFQWSFPSYYYRFSLSFLFSFSIWNGKNNKHTALTHNISVRLDKLLLIILFDNECLFKFVSRFSFSFPFKLFRQWIEINWKHNLKRTIAYENQQNSNNKNCIKMKNEKPKQMRKETVCVGLIK